MLLSILYDWNESLGFGLLVVQKKTLRAWKFEIRDYFCVKQTEMINVWMKMKMKVRLTELWSSFENKPWASCTSNTTINSRRHEETVASASKPCYHCIPKWKIKSIYHLCPKSHFLLQIRQVREVSVILEQLREMMPDHRRRDMWAKSCINK